jgi:hypothetical protein
LGAYALARDTAGGVGGVEEIVMMGLSRLVIALVLVGCSPVKVGQPGQTAWLWKTPRGNEFVVRACPQSISGDACAKLPKVEFTTNAQDREAWQFERRVQMRSVIGIPYGRQPVDVIVVGSKTRCEDIRLWVQNQTKDPTEPCEGPLYCRLAQ